jgi:hypothetical protein
VKTLSDLILIERGISNPADQGWHWRISTSELNKQLRIYNDIFNTRISSIWEREIPTG